MSNVPAELKYSKEHEWLRKEADGTYTVGITEHAQELLGDMVFVDLPEVGATVSAGDDCAVAESVKAASDIYAPVSGEIVMSFPTGHAYGIKSDDGKEIVDIPGYDSYIKKETVEALSAYKYVGNQNVYLTPNMTYKPRVMRNTKNVVVNGSVAVLIPKEDIHLTEKQMEYFSSDEYRKFYQIARNYQTRSLNVDATSVFFYGVLKECCNG